MYTENYKTFLKEIKEDLNKWTDISCAWIRRLNIIKMVVTLKVIYRFNTITMESPAVIFAETNKPILKLIWKYKRPRIAKTILKRAKLENSHFPISKLTTSYRNQEFAVLA